MLARHNQRVVAQLVGLRLQRAQPVVFVRPHRSQLALARP
jgi:hypothetical protein